MTDIHPLTYEKNVTCPYCGEEFATLACKHSRIRIARRDPDTCIYYDDPELFPYVYEVFECPHCGYVFTERRLKQGLLRNEGERTRLKEGYLDRLEGLPEPGKLSRTLGDAVVLYKKALLTELAMESPRIVVAGICLRLAFLQRFLADGKEEKRFLRLARDSYREAYENERVEPYGYPPYMVMFLAGELSRQLGEPEETRMWFGRLLGQQNLPPRFRETMLEIWQEFRREFPVES